MSSGQWQDEIDRIASRARITGWVIRFDPALEPPDEAESVIDINEQDRTARIGIAKSFLDLSEDDRKLYLAHEIAHLLFHPADMFALQVRAALRSKEAQRLIDAVYEDVNELLAWDIAKILMGVA